MGGEQMYQRECRELEKEKTNFHLVRFSIFLLLNRDIFGELRSPIYGTVEHVGLINELRADYLRSRGDVSNPGIVNPPLPSTPFPPRKKSQYYKGSSRCRKYVRRLLQRVQAKTSFIKMNYFPCRCFKERLVKCQAEKDDAEQRCKRLMQSIASAAEVSFYLFKLFYSIITSWLIATNAIDAINQSVLAKNGFNQPSLSAGKHVTFGKRGKLCHQYQVDTKRRYKHNEEGHKI